MSENINFTGWCVLKSGVKVSDFGNTDADFISRLEDAFGFDVYWEYDDPETRHISVYGRGVCDADWRKSFEQALADNCDAWRVAVNVEGEHDFRVFRKKDAHSAPEVVGGISLSLYDGHENEFARGLTRDALIACAHEALRRGLIEPLSAVFDCPSVVSAKVWTRDDVRECLADRGYDTSDDNVDAVLCTGDLDDALGDCTDGDWQIIYDAIDDAARSGDFEKVSGKER